MLYIHEQTELVAEKQDAFVDLFEQVYQPLMEGVGARLVALWETVAWIRERRGRRPAAGPARRWFRRAVLSAAAAGVLCIAWGALVEPYRVEVVRLRVETARLAPGARPIRVVQISDLHCEAEPRLEDDLPALVAAEKPDLIAFTGDAVNSPPGLALFRRTMEALGRVAPVVGVKGNWDRVYFRDPDRFDGTEVRAPDGGSVLVEAAGARARVAGVAFGNDGGVDAALDGAARGEVVLLLSHAPHPSRTQPHRRTAPTTTAPQRAATVRPRAPYGRVRDRRFQSLRPRGAPAPIRQAHARAAAPPCCRQRRAVSD